MSGAKPGEQNALVLSPEQLSEYAALDKALPALLIRTRNDELRREFTYAVLSLLSGVISLLTVVGGYIYLVLHGHPRAAAGLLATGVLGLIGGFIRSRL